MYAFAHSGLESIKIPKSVESLDWGVFSGCAFLSSIKIPYGVTYIDYDVFRNCTSLKSVSIPDSVTYIGYYAFLGCMNLTHVSIPASVEVIDSQVFDNCPKLVATVVEGSVAHQYCKDNSVPFVLAGMEDSWNPSPLEDFVIENGVVTKYTGPGGDVVIPSRDKDGNPVTAIGLHDTEWDGPFYECETVTSIAIPSSVTSIGNFAFCECTNLTSVKISNSVTSIGDWAFSGNNLTSVIIPNSVTDIGEYTFSTCRNLTSMTIGDSVRSIGERAFGGCSNLTSIDVESKNNHFSSLDGVLFNKEQTKIITCPGGKQGKYVIPNSVTSIGVIAFEDCSKLTGVTIPNSVTEIGSWAFCNCRGLTSVTIGNNVNFIRDYTFSQCISLTSVTIPNSVTEIRDWAFDNCVSLKSVTIPASVTYIGDLAFSKCPNLTAYIEPDSYAEQYCTDNSVPYSCIGTGDVGQEDSDGHDYWVIYRNAREGNRVEKACFNLRSSADVIPKGNRVEKASFTLYSAEGVIPKEIGSEAMVWDGALNPQGQGQQYVDVVKYYMVNGGWRRYASGELIVCEEASDVLASNMTVLDASGNAYVVPAEETMEWDVPSTALNYRGHYYFVFNRSDIRTWENAEYYCESRGGYLATIGDAAEDAFIYNNVLYVSGLQSAYFGLTDWAGEGHWKWINGEKLSYKNWSCGEPNNEYGNEAYGMYFKEYTDGRWNDGSFMDATGAAGRAFICEWGDYTRDESTQMARDYSGWGLSEGTIRHVEYALLCDICNEASNQANTSGMKDAFYQGLSRFPQGHPLNPENIGKDNIVAHRSGSGETMDAIEIKLDKKHAIVVFAGTKDFMDGLQDAMIVMDSNLLTAGVKELAAAMTLFDPETVINEKQPEAANHLIQSLVNGGYTDIFVAGHSLGGHLAANVTLNSDAVKECVAFDPPGRGEAWFQNVLNNQRAKRVINYLFDGSPVNMVGKHVGLSLKLKVAWSDSYPPLLHYHDISKAYDKLGGDNAIVQP